VSAEIDLVTHAPEPHAERRPNAVLNEAVPPVVMGSTTDPARLCPMLAGSALVKGDSVTVRTAMAEVVVNAPAPLLRSVFDRCDGTRTLDEVLAGIDDAASRQEFAEFLHFLLEQGALIDANLATVSAARYALQGNPFGLAAHSSVTNQICRRFLWNHESTPAWLPAGTVTVNATPLDDVFDARVSTYTFDERDIGVEELHALLWSLAGVVRTKHDRIGFVTPKRTVASAGGMQLVKVFVALQRKAGAYEPGVYRVEYPCERGLALTRVSDESYLTPRAFGKPWELTFATGAVFVVADPAVAAMRYRNRALQYLFMEAGAILHNGGLTAPQLGLGYATIGSYYETTVSRMCRLEGEMVLGSAIFGPKPTAEQVRWIDRSPDIDFAWVDGASPQFSMPFCLGRAKMKTADDARLHTWGRDANPWLAARKAVAEAVEREGFREPRGIVNARIASLRSAIDPREFVRYTLEQHALDGFAYQPFDADHMYSWAGGIELSTGTEVHVLAELVFSRTSLAAAGHAVDRPYTQVTSSGCAAGVSKDDAVLRALLEVVERDAFMRHWLAQRPGTVIPQSQLPSDIAQRVEALERAGCRVAIQHLDSTWAHVCLVAAQHAGAHFTTMGTAANANFVSAIHAALEELEARVFAWLNGNQPSVTGPAQITSTEHHFELYGLKRYFRRADRVLFPTGGAAQDEFPEPVPAKTAYELVKRLVEGGLRPIAVDITPQLCYVDQGRVPLSVVKTLVPGLLPISFGHAREPRAMVARVHPGSHFPHPFP
jgi:ribosomal protein S12 methylthiotransferase accessory factor